VVGPVVEQFQADGLEELLLEAAGGVGQEPAKAREGVQERGGRGGGVGGGGQDG
jgi:hypothetical protein